jgi:hypothetical protein
MEIMLRCCLPDRPGALAALAGAVAAGGGDIQAVDVVEHDGGRALDDLVVVLRDGANLADVLARIEAVDEVEVVHVGPSRGHPADATTRLALGLEAALTGAQTAEQAVTTLIGGLLRAQEIEIVDGSVTPSDDAELAVPLGARTVIARRAYRFTTTEQWRAEAIARVCIAASQAAQPSRPG